LLQENCKVKQEKCFSEQLGSIMRILIGKKFFAQGTCLRLTLKQRPIQTTGERVSE